MASPRREVEIIKSGGDERKYRGLVLENGMKIVLVSDPTTDKAAAALDVNIGSMSDPVPGLAHFCEHMLFLGTKKYQDENEYNRYLSQVKVLEICMSSYVIRTSSVDINSSIHSMYNFSSILSIMEAATRTQQVITLTTTLTSLLIIWVELLIGKLFIIH